MNISKNISVIVLVFFVQICFGQKNDSKQLIGKVLEHSTPIEGINIINNRTQVATVSDSEGNFSMQVKEGDVLVFSAVNLEPQNHRVVSGDLYTNILVIKITAKEVALKDVLFN